MRFVDEVKIEVQAGDGGNGIVAHGAVKNMCPKEGPLVVTVAMVAVLMIADESMHSLLDFRYNPLLRAQKAPWEWVKGCMVRMVKIL